MKQKVLCLRISFITFFILFLSVIAFAEVPIPWGAKLIREDVIVTGNGEEKKIASYETKANKQELFDYYLKGMPNRGYNLFMNGAQNLIFNKEEEMVMVLVPPSRDDKTQFMISTASIRPAVSDSYDKPVTCEPIPSVPVYSGARCMNSTRLKSGGPRSAAYATDDSVSEVLNFYYSQMPKYSWKLEKEGDLIADMEALPAGMQASIPDFYRSARTVVFVDQKGSSCSINVMGNPTAKGGALINIVYEDKTRQR